MFSIAISPLGDIDDLPTKPTINNDHETHEKSIYSFLLMGRDRVSELCDVVILVSYDTKNQTVNALQIPRDTYASYTTAAYRKINGAVHSLGGEAEFKSFLSNALSVEIDYYISADLDTIAKTIDKLGGIEVLVPEDMYYSDPYQDLEISIKSGLQTLNGYEVTQFLRYRAGYVTGDLGRLDAQKIFLAALVKKVLNESELPKMVSLATSILDDVRSDLTIADCIYLIKKISGLRMDGIGFMTLPGEAICSESGAWYYILNREATYVILKEYFSMELSESDLDKDKLFTSVYRHGFNEIYYAENKYTIERFTAEQICKEGINID